MRILYFIIALLVIINISLLFKIKELQKKNTLSAEYLDNNLQLHKQRLLIHIKNDNDIIIPSDYILKDLTGGKNLKSVIKQPKLIFRFTEFNCNTCFEHEIPALQKIAKKIGKNNIVILASYDHPRYLKILKDKYKLEFDIFNIPLNLLNKNAIESLNYPYYFILNKSMTGSRIFIPEKTLDSSTQDYFKLIEDVFL